MTFLSLNPCVWNQSSCYFYEDTLSRFTRPSHLWPPRGAEWPCWHWWAVIRRADGKHEHWDRCAPGPRAPLQDPPTCLCEQTDKGESRGEAGWLRRAEPEQDGQHFTPRSLSSLFFVVLRSLVAFSPSHFSFILLDFPSYFFISISPFLFLFELPLHFSFFLLSFLPLVIDSFHKYFCI